MILYRDKTESFNLEVHRVFTVAYFPWTKLAKKNLNFKIRPLK
jgi:hypothetical protein